MKSFLLLAFSAIALAAPASRLEARARVSDTANEMLDVISGKAQCPKNAVAVIFARGTFDSGNIGVWVGPQFEAAIKSLIPHASFQGVDPKAYPANLKSYLSEEGGSAAGAASLAKVVKDYAVKCSDSLIIVSGWSQGAVVAHKALALIPPAAQKHVVGLVTFGDPAALFGHAALPKYLPSASFSRHCIAGTMLDPLCAKLPSDFKVPTSVHDIIGTFTSGLPGICVGIQQTTAVASLLVHFPGEILGSLSSFISTLRPTQLVRLMLTPQHFTYGNNPAIMKAAASFVANLPALKKQALKPARASSLSKANSAASAKKHAN